ncbi:MAG: hypothetical protein IJA20_07460 [Methanocorpusculum sp.]|nr:hypothetical protein [Methanocorpusculum sp.]
MLRDGGGGLEGFGIWCANASATKNRSPSPLTVVSFAVLLPSAPSLSVSNETCKLGASVFFAVASLFEPCSRLESLRASRHPPPLNMYWVGWGGAQAFPRERITRVGLFAR